MHKVLQKIVAHESSVKAITIDKDEYFMATGSSEGNIKVNKKNITKNIFNFIFIQDLELEEFKYYSKLSWRSF
jgi:hypothetical protein